MSAVQPIGEHSYGYGANTHYDFTGVSWGTSVRCNTCRATIDNSEIKAHQLWHEQLVEAMREELIEMAKGLAVEILKELANQ